MTSDWYFGGERTLMRGSQPIRSITAGAVWLLLANGAQAQAIRGSMGSQSRATIAIRVSVSPRIAIHPMLNGVLEQASTLSSNAPRLRLRLVEQSREQLGEDALASGATGLLQPSPAQPSAPDTGRPKLLLITPD